jgi:hypothetical protein
MPSKTFDQINAAVTTPINGSVSPSLHPNSLIPFGEVLAADDAPSTASAYRAGCSALATMYATTSDIIAADAATRSQFGFSLAVDGRKIQVAVPEDKKQQLAADMGARFAAVAKGVDQHFHTVNETIDRLTSSIDRALTNPKRNETGVAAAASDIRKFIAALSDEKRMNFLHAAVAADDHEVVTAVLGTSGFVSGLPRESVAVLRNLASQKFAPREHAQLDAAQKLRDHLTVASRVFVQKFKELTPVLRESKNTTAIRKLREGA